VGTGDLGRRALEVAGAMTADAVAIAPLDASSPLAGMVATIQFSFWGPLTGFTSAADYERFLRTASASALPSVLIASRGKQFAGSVNLLAQEMTTRPELSPWLGQLFVVEEERRGGVGRLLVRTAVDHVAALGHRRLHLYTSGTLPRFYESLGWKPIEMVDYLGKPRTIMAFDAA
jgi:predicted N-acetyltransferase YhbS